MYPLSKTAMEKTLDKHGQMDLLFDLPALLKSLPGGAIKLWYDGKSIDVICMSDGLYKLIGYTKDEYYDMVNNHGRNGFLIFRDNEEEIYEYLNDAVNIENDIINEMCIKNKFGEDIWIQVRGQVVDKQEGRTCLQYLVYDITKQKELKYFSIDILKEKESYQDNLTDICNSTTLLKKTNNLSGYNIKSVDDDLIVSNPQSIVFFALELLDKTKDLNSAINMILDRLSRYYDIEEIALIKRMESDKTEIAYSWRKDRDEFKKKDVIISQEFYDMLCYKTEEEDIKLFSDSKHGDFIAAKVFNTEGNTSYMLFFNKNSNIRFQEAEYEVKGIASLLASHLFRMQESKKNDEYVNYVLNYDSLTGFPNYAKFLQQVEQEIAENINAKYCIIYCDFSNFKYINETYGYNEGDVVLKKFGVILQKECRDGLYFTRVNSDKFVIMLRGSDIETHKMNFVKMARQYCAGIKKEYDKSNIIIIGGISELDRNLPFVSSSVDRSNIARKSIKNLGESDCAVYNGFFQSQMDTQMEITRHMVGALANGEFVVYLQPKIDLQNEKIVGAEALVRWKRDGNIIFYPDSFIPLFEQNGFVTKLDYYVLEQVLIWLRDAINKGENIVPISLNFSRSHHKEENFVEHVVDLLHTYKIPSGYIEAEITESMFMNDMELLNNNLKMMKESGISVSIDDFGSGYSSLNVLASVSADIIKLDKAFLKQMDEIEGADFLGNLIMMIKKLGFKVIAEGVETEEQKQLLISTGCDMAQGYYYARPMPIEIFQNYIDEHNKSLFS